MSNVYSVEQVNRYIKNMFTQDFMLSRISVGGEVSNCKYHSSGHIYFSLKDGSGSLACVMFAGQRKGLAFAMKNGDRVVVTGSVDVYERDGKYQMYARKITLEGAGILYERFLALKEELEDMGRLVNSVLDMAERMAQRHIPMTMEDWAKRIDIILEAGGDTILKDAGKVTAEYAKEYAESEFEKYRLIQDRLFRSDFDRLCDGDWPETDLICDYERNEKI